MRGPDEELNRAPARLPMPKPDEGLPVAAPIAAAAQQPSARPADPKARAESDGHLLAARRALAVGDVKRALAAVEAARKLNVAYAPNDDAPERVEAAISKYRQVTEGAGNRSDETTRRQVADLLLEQSQELLRWKDFDEAERLARHVQSLRIPYGPFEAKPEALLERVGAERARTGRLAVKGESPKDSAVRIVGGPLSAEPKHPARKLPTRAAMAAAFGPPRPRRKRPPPAKMARRKPCRRRRKRRDRFRRSYPWR